LILKYIVRRALAGLVVVLGVTLITFVLISSTAGTFVPVKVKPARWEGHGSSLGFARSSTKRSTLSLAGVCEVEKK